MASSQCSLYTPKFLNYSVNLFLKASLIIILLQIPKVIAMKQSQKTITSSSVMIWPRVEMSAGWISRCIVAMKQRACVAIKYQASQVNWVATASKRLKVYQWWTSVFGWCSFKISSNSLSNSLALSIFGQSTKNIVAHIEK